MYNKYYTYNGNRVSQDELRRQVKILKAVGDKVTYKELAEYLEMNKNSFYNWIQGYYNFSDEKAVRLNEIINDMKEG